MSARRMAALTAVLIGSALFALVFTKARVASFTHDESYSFLHYPHQSFMAIISFSDWFPNNHILNSLGMKYAEKLFGNSELALRSPNLLLLLVFMAYGFLLFREAQPLLAVALFTLLGTNPLLMDLFGLARGYGLSCGFLLMSLYHLITWLEGGKRRDLLVFHTAALLASLSNFTLLLYYAAALMSCIAIVFVRARISGAKQYGLYRSNRMHLLPLLVALAVLYEPVRRLIMNSDLAFGGSTGFYADTVKDLVTNALHSAALAPGITLLMQLLVTAIMVAAMMLIVRMVLRRQVELFEAHMGLVVSTGVAALLPVVIITQHLVLGSDYPVARFSAFLFPIYLVQAGFLCQYLVAQGYRLVVPAAVSVLALVAAISFTRKIDLYASAEWIYDSRTKDMVRVLSADRAAAHSQNAGIRLGINWLFEPTTNYYRETLGLDWLLPVDREGNRGNEDYFYLFAHDQGQLDTIPCVVLADYPDAGTILLKRR